MIFFEKFHRAFSFLCLRTAAVCVPPGSGSRLISFGMMWIIRRDHWVIMPLKFFHPPDSSHQSIEPNDSSLTSAEALQMCQSSRSRQGIVILWKVHPRPFWPKCVEPAISTQFVHRFCALNLKQLTRSPKSSRSLCHLWHTHILYMRTLIICGVCIPEPFAALVAPKTVSETHRVMSSVVPRCLLAMP